MLPLPHNKPVSVDEGKHHCLTSISCELLPSITNDTIIAKSYKTAVRRKTYDREWLLKGYDNAKRTGL